MLATMSGYGPTATYRFEPGPRYRVTDMRGLKHIDIRFTEIGADGNLTGRVKEKAVHSWDAPFLNERFALAQANGDGKYVKGGRAGAILKTMIEKEIARKKGAPTYQALTAEARRASRPPPPPPAQLPPGIAACGGVNAFDPAGAARDVRLRSSGLYLDHLIPVPRLVLRINCGTRVSGL